MRRMYISLNCKFVEDSFCNHGLTTSPFLLHSLSFSPPPPSLSLSLPLSLSLSLSSSLSLSLSLCPSLSLPLSLSLSLCVSVSLPSLPLLTLKSSGICTKCLLNTLAHMHAHTHAHTHTHIYTHIHTPLAHTSRENLHFYFTQTQTQKLAELNKIMIAT